MYSNREAAHWDSGMVNFLYLYGLADLSILNTHSSLTNDHNWNTVNYHTFKYVEVNSLQKKYITRMDVVSLHLSWTVNYSWSIVFHNLVAHPGFACMEYRSWLLSLSLHKRYAHYLQFPNGFTCIVPKWWVNENLWCSKMSAVHAEWTLATIYFIYIILWRNHITCLSKI